MRGLQGRKGEEIGGVDEKGVEEQGEEARRQEEGRGGRVGNRKRT